jgi:hypothetical protein
VCLRCSKSELLVVLKQPEGLEGPTHISLFTDNANHLVLHWGTCKPGTVKLGVADSLQLRDGISFRRVLLSTLRLALVMSCKAVCPVSHASLDCTHTKVVCLQAEGRWSDVLPCSLRACLPPCAGSRDWQRPDKTLRPAGTVALEGGVACETDFSECSEDAECDVEVAGAKVPLQRISVTLPPDMADVGGLTFVLRRCVTGKGSMPGMGWQRMLRTACSSLPQKGGGALAGSQDRPAAWCRVAYRDLNAVQLQLTTEFDKLVKFCVTLRLVVPLCC